MLLACIPICAAAQTTTDDSQLVIEDIHCRGNAITSCDFIRDRLYVANGEIVDEEEIFNAKLRLSSLPNFTSVDIHLEKGSVRGKAVVVIEVVEANPWIAESLIVTAAIDSYVYERVAGRISNENLFGTGKVLSLEGGAEIPLSGYEGEAYYTRLQYVDPRLFDTRNYFLIAGAYFERASLAFDSGTIIDNEFAGVDLSVGRRIFDFSYVTLGYRYRATASINNYLVHQDGAVEIVDRKPGDVWLASYGWNTEDDPFFPTRGSRSQFSWAFEQSEDYHYLDIGYRQTFKRGKSIWTLKLGNTPGIVYRQSLDNNFDVAINYSRDLADSGSGEIQRGRWYIEPNGQSPSAHIWQIGIKAGVRLDTKTFGHVDLYVFGSDTFREDDGQ
jgi:outer membrane protein assembly factor BamA